MTIEEVDVITSPTVDEIVKSSGLSPMAARLLNIYLDKWKDEYGEQKTSFSVTHTVIPVVEQVELFFQSRAATPDEIDAIEFLLRTDWDGINMRGRVLNLLNDLRGKEMTWE